MTASSDDAARLTAQRSIASERAGISGPGAELARLHAQVAALVARLAAANIA